MPFIPTPHGVEVVVKGDANGIPVNNVYHVNANAVVTDDVLENCATAFHTWMVADMLPALSNQYYLREIIATDISVEDGHQVSQVLTSGNQGANSGAAAGANVALCISWRTARIGRSYRGRTYVGGLANAYLDNSTTFSSAATAYMATQAATLIDTLETLGYTLAVLSKVANKIARITGVLTEIIAIVVDSKVDSQRRRTAN